MMYSPELMEENRDQRAAPAAEELGERVSELEGLVDALGRAPDGDLVWILDRAVGLLGEINTGLEASFSSVREGSEDLGRLLERVDFGPFDAALEELESEGPGSGGPDRA